MEKRRDAINYLRGHLAITKCFGYAVLDGRTDLDAATGPDLGRATAPAAGKTMRRAPLLTLMPTATLV